MRRCSARSKQKLEACGSEPQAAIEPADTPHGLGDEEWPVSEDAVTCLAAFGKACDDGKSWHDTVGHRVRIAEDVHQAEDRSGVDPRTCGELFGQTPCRRTLSVEQVDACEQLKRSPHPHYNNVTGHTYVT